MKTVKVLALKTDYGFDLVKVSDFDEIISYGIMMTPGLVINGEVRSVGKMPTNVQLIKWLKE